MKKTSQLQRLFNEGERAQLKAAVAGDKVIIPAIETIIKDKCSELMKPTGISDFERSSWALEKAYREGGAFYLQQLLDTFKEK